MMFYFFLAIVLLYLVGCAVPLYLSQDRIIFPRHMTPPPLPAPPNKDTVSIRLDIEGGGQVEAWFIPAPTATPQQPGPAVIFFHGNGEIIDYLDDIIEPYRAMGCSVLLPEYRGYGRSAGKPSEKAICGDAVRFYDELIKRGDVDKARIVFHGRSLGGGVAANLSKQRRPTAMILQSTFKNVACMAYRVGGLPFLVRHPFRTDRAVAGTDIPLLIFHGTRDDIVPVSHGRALRDLAPKATYVEYDCGHNDFPGSGNERTYWREIAEFLRRSGVLRE